MKLKREASGDSTVFSPMLFVLILGCFFVSGLTGLIYEILWTRMIVKITGCSPFAVSIVLTVFMAGLGFGSYLAGRTIDHIKNPLKLIRAYGILELSIGAYGIVLPLLLLTFKPFYAILYNHLFNYFLTYNLLTFAGCSLILIIPVTCMGATLPVLSRFFVTSLSRVGTHVGRLYGLNTIGAAVGSLLCGFWLINLLGVWGTLFFAIILNAVIGITCIIVSKTQPNKIAEGEAKERPAIPEKDNTPADTPSYMQHALVIFAVSGFCAMAYEVIWIKLLGLIVGPTTYSFTIVLVTFISGLALGSLFFGWLSDRTNNTILLLLFTQVAAALSALLVSQAMGNSQIFFAKLIYHFNNDFICLSLLKAIILFMFMFPPTFCLGATFPLVGKIYTKSLDHTGRTIGFAYAINSIGAVLGSFCAGFLLIPFLGKEHGVGLVVAMQLVTVLVIACLILIKTRRNVARYIPLALPALLGLVLVFHYPNWNRKMLSIGKYHRLGDPNIINTGWLKALVSGSELDRKNEFQELLFYGDGVGGFTTVLKEQRSITADDNLVMCNSGKPDASSTGDMDTQTLLAHFPLLFHPSPEKVLVIGLASGITAGEILNYPVKTLDIVEINEQVAAASNFFIPWNNNVLTDARTRLIIQDGRAHVELSEGKYDIITSEPSNPWMAGIAALYTKDFFELAREKLDNGGIFVQWIHIYQMDWPTFALVGRTFASAFPNSLLVSTNPARQQDFLLVGFKGERKLDVGVAAQNLAYAKRSKNITLLDHKIFYNFIFCEDLKLLFGEGPINTDNHPILEFSAPKTMHLSDPAIAKKIMSNKEVGLSRKTAEIIHKNTKDVESQINLAAYFLSFNNMGDIPLKYPVNLSGATEAQEERYYDFVEAYCSNNNVADFHLISDVGLRQRCVSARLKTVSDMIGQVKNKAFAYSYLTGICLENGRLDEAVKFASDALDIEPEQAQTHYNLGISLARNSRMDESVKHFNEALRINPNFFEAHYNVGELLVKQGKQDEAVHHFNEAIRINPGYAESYKNLGDILRRQGKIQEAIVQYSTAIKLKPNFSEAQVSIGEAHFVMGNILVGKGEVNDAVIHFQEALRINNNFAEAHTNLGYALLTQGKENEAIKHCLEALRLDPEKSINAYYNLACIYARKNKATESVAWLKKAVDKGFNDWDTLKADKDLENIRNTAFYAELIQTLIEPKPN